METIWEKLGISQTVDIQLIKEAYAEKIKVVHPEEDPEGFKALQTAYRTAVAWAKNQQNSVEPPSYSFDDAYHMRVDEEEKSLIEQVQSTHHDFSHLFSEEEEIVQLEERTFSKQDFSQFEVLEKETTPLSVFAEKDSEIDEWLAFEESDGSSEEEIVIELSAEERAEFEEELSEISKGEAFVADFIAYIGLYFTFEKLVVQLRKPAIQEFLGQYWIRREIEKHLLNSYMAGKWTTRQELVKLCNQLEMTELAAYIAVVGFTVEELQVGQDTRLEEGILE